MTRAADSPELPPLPDARHALFVSFDALMIEPAEGAERRLLSDTLASLLLGLDRRLGGALAISVDGVFESVESRLGSFNPSIPRPDGAPSAVESEGENGDARRFEITIERSENIESQPSAKMPVDRHHLEAAMRQLMQQAPFRNRIPVFIGQGPDDEDGIREAQAWGGTGIEVGAGHSVAHWRLADASAVTRWLRELLWNLPDDWGLAEPLSGSDTGTV